MTDGQLVWLAVIAIALVVMAIVQVALVVFAVRLARQATDTLQQVRRDVRPVVSRAQAVLESTQPILERAQRISDEAARATALAAAQVEHVDRILALTAVRVDQTLTIIQGAVLQPVKQGAAIVAAIRAAVTVFRGVGDRHRSGRNEEEALFVG